ncbi:LamG domain-containing protein [Luminiphilus sp.]|nr:LamG domain-containing protein [Luminiphilus sp.]
MLHDETAAATEQVVPTAKLPPRTLIGYSSVTSVRAGDNIDFLVNTIDGGTFDADLVRVINGDGLSRYADKFELKSVDAPFAGGYQGQPQPLNLGSYVEVDNTAALDQLNSFTVAGWIHPTFDPSNYQPPQLENPDPFSPPTLNIGASVGEQTIVSRFDAVRQSGWTLYLDENLHLVFAVGDGKGAMVKARIGKAAKTGDWSYVMASFDTDTQQVSLHLVEKPFASGDRATARSLSASQNCSGVIQQGPLRIAAVRGGEGAACATREKPVQVFTGRIQDIRLFSSVLGAQDIDAIAAEQLPSAYESQRVADWDFGRGIKTTQAEDISPNALHGTVVNLAERGVRGRFWRGDTIRWTDAPDQYDAITFHADDLYDAQWTKDFSYTIPEDLPSGVYAARLKQGDFCEYITFFVAAPKGQPRAKLALWMADYDYLAYSNITLVATARQNYPGHNFNMSDVDFLFNNLEYGTGGVYNMHMDGHYFAYGSRLRPDLHMKPNGLLTYNFVQDTHIIAFLENAGIACDIITDELVDREGAELLQQYRAIVSSSHPEYPSAAMFDAISVYTDCGGRFFYGGGNGWFWATGSHPSLPGVFESRNFHEIGDRYLTNGNQGGTMTETGRGNSPVFGVEMSGMIFNGSSPYRRLQSCQNPRAEWIFKGTSEGKVFGDYGVDRVHGGAAGFEIDKYNPASGSPRHALHLASSEPLRETIEDVQMSPVPIAVSYHPSTADVWAAADVVFFETPNGGAMFSTGSINWFSSTLENEFDNDVATISRNVIERFLDPAAFEITGPLGADSDERTPPHPDYD